MSVNVGGPYRIPGQVEPDPEPEPRPLAKSLATLAYAFPDVLDELAPLVGEPRPDAENFREPMTVTQRRLALLAWALIVAMPPLYFLLR